MFWDGFDEAIVGLSVSQIERQVRVVVYDYDGMIRVLMERDGMEHEEAVEFLDYNTLGGWVGELTPMAIGRCP